jgi:hypothetical protein
MYRIYLLEELSNGMNEIELDTEDIDFSVVFSVSDVADISKRKDHMTKQIAFKGTKKNNSAFGSLFHLNKFTDKNLENKLFFNYNPLQIVDCLIYEDSSLLLRGSLRVIEVSVDKQGNVIYQTVVTGVIIDFKEILADKKLEELDFSDLSHTYDWAKIKQSWATQTERYNKDTNTFYNEPYNLGSGYVYPFIDYGETFSIKELNKERFDPFVNIRNFRPAIFVKEFFDRIFEQPELKGYTYEIKDNTPAKTVERKFNSLIIPSNVEKLTEKNNFVNARIWRQTTQATEYQQYTKYDVYSDYEKMDMPIELDAGLAGPMFHPLLEWFGNYRGLGKAVMRVKKNFVADSVVKVHFLNFKNVTGDAPYMKVKVELCERDWINPDHEDFDRASTWKPIASNFFIATYNTLYPEKVVQFETGEHKFEEGKQIMVRICLEDGYYKPGITSQLKMEYQIKPNETFIAIPKNQAVGTITQDLAVGEVIKPKAPENIKQIDFIKSIITLFNFYVYNDPMRPKHLLFETHDQYYVYTNVNTLKSSALDWTGKVDLNGGFRIKSNMSLPKKYSFMWKDDNDWISKDYKNLSPDPYGSFNFTDELGVIDQKKVELIFSPTPAVEYVGTERIHPTILQKDGETIKPIKSNIRIQFYNGVKGCMRWNVGKDDFQQIPTGAWTWVSTILEDDIQVYPMCSEYYMLEGVNEKKPVDVLQFGLPKWLYFGNTAIYESTKNIYGYYYINQISQLTDPNTLFIDCDVYLNEIDIAYLNLRIPVFIDLGPFGHAYYKVINVEYSQKKSPARVQLQRIAI